MKTYCLALIAVAAVTILWLTFSVLPGKAVMTLEPAAKNEELHGPAFGIVSSSRVGGTLRTEIVQRNGWRHVTDIQTGWGAVTSWAPCAVIVALISLVLGSLIGWWFHGKDAEMNAKKLVKDALEALETDLVQTKTRLRKSEISYFKCDHERKEALAAFYRAKPWVDEVERDAAAKIKNAEKVTMEETARADKAEDELIKVSYELRETLETLERERGYRI